MRRGESARFQLNVRPLFPRTFVAVKSDLFALVQDFLHFFDGEHTAEGHAACRSVSGRIGDFLFLRFSPLKGLVESVRRFWNGDRGSDRGGDLFCFRKKRCHG